MSHGIGSFGMSHGIRSYHDSRFGYGIGQNNHHTSHNMGHFDANSQVNSHFQGYQNDSKGHSHRGIPTPNGQEGQSVIDHNCGHINPVHNPQVDSVEDPLEPIPVNVSAYLVYKILTMFDYNFPVCVLKL